MGLPALQRNVLNWVLHLWLYYRDNITQSIFEIFCLLSILIGTLHWDAKPVMHVWEIRTVKRHYSVL